MRLAVSVAPRRVAGGEFEAIPSRRTEDARAAEPTHGAVVKALGTIRRLGFVLACGIAAQAHANHPVLVEGNNAANGSPGITVVPAGTAGDYDGDGLVGTAEDMDNSTDRVFGTLTTALLAVNSGAGANGHVTIVTSGRFPEALRIPNTQAGQAALNGVLVVEAAPGVQAVIDAVVAGSPDNAARQSGPGIVIDTQDADRLVVLRNLVVRNFTVGLEVRGRARVVVENCRFDSNLETNVRVRDDARLTMTDTSIRAGGMRFNPAQGAPAPGDGIVFEGAASGSLAESTVAGNVAAGIRNAGSGTVRALSCNVFDNGADLAGTIDVQPAPPICEPPVVTAAVGPCKRCKTRNGVTTCKKCGVSVGP